MTLALSLALSIWFSTNAEGLLENTQPGVFFVTPKEGAKLESPVEVRFATHGLEVHPAGRNIPGTGHFLLVIDSRALKEGESAPKTNSYREFLLGETSTLLELSKGPHTLILQAMNGAGVALSPRWTKSIRISVQ